MHLALATLHEYYSFVSWKGRHIANASNPSLAMTYQSFEDLPVWNEAIKLAELCEDFLDAAGNAIRRGKQDQLERCSLSVSNNIAEGFERGTTNELLAFIYIARGSAGETRSMMRFFARRPAMKPWLGMIEKIAKTAESCGRQLRGWADALQNSDIKGQRHLNEKSRAEFGKKKVAEAGRSKFAQMEKAALEKMPDGHPFKEAMRRKGKI